MASGSGWNLWVWLLGVVVRSYIDFLILLIPTPLVSVLFCSSLPTFCSFFNINIYNSSSYHNHPLILHFIFLLSLFLFSIFLFFPHTTHTTLHTHTHTYIHIHTHTHTQTHTHTHTHIYTYTHTPHSPFIFVFLLFHLLQSKCALLLLKRGADKTKLNFSSQLPAQVRASLLHILTCSAG